MPGGVDVEAYLSVSVHAVENELNDSQRNLHHMYGWRSNKVHFILLFLHLIWIHGIIISHVAPSNRNCIKFHFSRIHNSVPINWEINLVTRPHWRWPVGVDYPWWLSQFLLLTLGAGSLQWCKTELGMFSIFGGKAFPHLCIFKAYVNIWREQLVVSQCLCVMPLLPVMNIHCPCYV